MLLILFQFILLSVLTIAFPSFKISKGACQGCNKVNGIRDLSPEIWDHNPRIRNHRPGILDHKSWHADQQILVGLGIRLSHVLGI